MAVQDLKMNVAFIIQLQNWEKHLTSRSMPSISLEEADGHGWVKCYFIMKDPEERGIVNQGKTDFSEYADPTTCPPAWTKGV